MKWTSKWLIEKSRHVLSYSNVQLEQYHAPYVEIWQRDNQDITAWHYRHDGPGEIVEINSIDVQIDIADIYQGLDFAI